MNIAELRKQANITQEEIAKKAGIARSSYTNIENGERRPSVETAKKIAAVLGISWTAFYEDGEEKGA